ncbi:MAG: carboxypeptidase-like regulatory domain-containing protein [Acidobacteriota bacterium]|jgi:hypothetical protein|nr:MAG: hypothetical protein DIU54_13000 [Acidobacteriota bacterium]
MDRRVRRGRWFVLLLLVLLPATAAAQITTGVVTGVVQDEQGGVIPGATVLLISESRNTRSVPVTTGADGGYSFPNVAPDTYTIEVTMSGFRTIRRSGVQVSPGDRVGVPPIVLTVGAAEVVEVTADAPVIQSQSGERSFTVATDAVVNLPIPTRSFASLAALAPGVDGTSRVGGGGQTNFMMDGVGTMDTGSNRLLMAVNTESIAEVKILTSGYQAEYGRSSGLQITAVTKSGTNQFHGSLYDVERNSRWNANSRVNQLNGDPKPKVEQREWGFSIGGPVGRPGGDNRLFFFYAQEFQPRTSGNNVVRFRVPTALERMGDFSQSTDQNGNLMNLIRDASTGLPCTASDTRGCFQHEGVLGRIPPDRLYEAGLNVLRRYPLPNLTSEPGVAFNYEATTPVEKLTSYQPAVRLDLQATPALRVSYKFSAWHQPRKVVLGNIPGFNDTIMQRPFVATNALTVNYTINPTTFFEATWGRSSNEQAGCGLTGDGPNFCRSALPVNDIANRFNAGLGDIPYLFPDATILNPAYYAYSVMEDVRPSIWDGERLQLAPSFNWGNRIANAPPNTPFPGFLNVNRTWDFSASVTKVLGPHTVKVGFYNTHSYKAQQRGNWNGTINFGNDSNNPLDAGFGYANAALGIFSSYSQASAYVEGNFVYRNTEWYVQDNWKVNSRLTLDYGLRFVNQTPQYDRLGQASNFLPDRWDPGAAPALYVAACANGEATCSGSARQAMNPITGELLGPNSALAIGTLVPGSGDFTNGLFLSGEGIVKTTYKYPTLGLNPRFGMAYDLTGTQSVVLRGSVGLFFDRPDGNAIMPQVENPPSYTLVTARYGNLQSISSAGLSTQGAPALSVYEYESRLPSSTQWNTGVQMALPWNAALDVAYVGQHGFNLLQSVNLNAIDFGAAFLPENQDPTLPPSSTPGATAVHQDQLRAFRGYGDITQQWSRGWRTYHSLQISLNRRFSNGLSFGFNDTISLYDRQATGARLEHFPDGTYRLRADQAEADELLGNALGPRHRFKGHFVWDLPDLRDRSGIGGRLLQAIVNDWQLSGVWTAATGSPYTIGYSYASGGANINLTGSPNYGARIRIVGDPGDGCSSDPYRQFNIEAFAGPLPGSVGLESGNQYLRGCFTSTLDLALARNIRLGGGRSVQVRVDVFNAPNSAIITGRQTTMQLSSPNAPTTPTNSPFDANGELIPARSRPNGAGFGVASGYQAPRTVQLQLRFSF